MHPSVAVLAAAVHFSVPGHWLNGGYEELVGWGLVTNVAGASLAFLAGVNRVPATHLGVSRFGQSGDLGSVYAHHGLDADAVVGAAFDLL